MNPPAPRRSGDAARSGAERLGGDVIVRNTAWIVAGRVAFMLGWAIVTPYVLSRLGTDRFAFWALLFALSGYFATFDLGISQALVKFVAEFTASGEAGALRAVVRVATQLYAGLGALAVVLLVAWRGPLLDLLRTPDALRDEAGWSLIGMSAVLAIANLAGVLVAVLNGRQRMDVTSRVLLWSTATQLAGTLAVLSLGAGLRGLVAVAGLAQIVAAVGYARGTRRHVPELRVSHEPAPPGLLRRVFRYSAALQVTNLGTLLQFQLDKVVLAHFAALAPVAWLELGVRLTTAVWVLPMLLLPPLVPAFAALAAHGERERLSRLYWRATRYLAALSLPLTGFLVAGAPALVTAWLGPGHPEVARATAALGGFLFVTVQTGVCTAALRGLEHPWLEARYHLLGSALHIGLSLWLVPRFGLDGALTALLVSGAVSAAYLVAAFHAWIREPLVRWLSVLGWPTALTAAALAIGWRWPGSGWHALAPAGRGDALAQVAALAAVFLVVVGAGYVLTGFLPLAEVRSLVHRAARRAESAAPKELPRSQ